MEVVDSHLEAGVQFAGVHLLFNVSHRNMVNSFVVAQTFKNFNKALITQLAVINAVEVHIDDSLVVIVFECLADQKLVEAFRVYHHIPAFHCVIKPRFQTVVPLLLKIGGVCLRDRWLRVVQ